MVRNETQESQRQTWSGGAAAAVTEAEAAPARKPEPALEKVLYSIRLPAPSVTACGRCGVRFHAAGPTGYADEEPLCDPCFLRAEESLGIVLALVSVVRLFAVSVYPSKEEYWQSLAQVGAFGRLFERVVSRSGPPRIFRLPFRHGAGGQPEGGEH